MYINRQIENENKMNRAQIPRDILLKYTRISRYSLNNINYKDI